MRKQSRLNKIQQIHDIILKRKTGGDEQMLKQKRSRNHWLKKLGAAVMTSLLMLSFTPMTILECFAAEMQDEQETPSPQPEGLEYQTISTQPGDDDTELVTLDGLMPVNAEVNVQTSTEHTEANLFAYDISITDREGTDFQPESSEPIKVEITNTAISSVNTANQKPRLWHIDNSGLREEIKNFKIKDGTITFEASGFSVYELDDGTPPLRTYEFWMPNNPDSNDDYHEYYFPTSSTNSDGTYKEIWKQTIKGTEKPVFPQLPADFSSRYTFIGWFKGSSAGPMFDFNNVPEVTETETVKLYAVFRSCVYAIFHDQYNGKSRTFPVYATRRGDLVNGVAQIPYRDLTVTYDDQEADENPNNNQPPEMAFKGWSETAIEDYSAGGTATVYETPTLSLTETKHFYPVFEPIRWLQFVSGQTGSGATYIPPKYFSSDKGFSFSDEDASSAPVRAGYVFDGWFTEETGGTRVTDAQQQLVSNLNTDELEVRNGRLYLKDDTLQSTLYARWVPGDSKYTVLIWQQKATDAPNLADSAKTYDLADSVLVDATTDSPASVADKYKQFATKNNSNYDSNYEGFQYSRCSTETTVSGDGKTILNVYYDRIPHTFTFRKNNGNEYYPQYQTIHTFTALYGADIKNKFPIPGYKDYIWTDRSEDVYQYALATLETMPNADVTFNGKNRTATEKIYYYVEIDEEDAADYSRTYVFNQKLYGLHKAVDHGFYFLTYDEEYHPLEGYIRDKTWAIPYFGQPGVSSYDNSNITNPSRAPIGGHDTGRTTEYNINYLFYDRDSFQIDFVNSKDHSIISEPWVKFKRKIEQSVPNPPEAAAGERFTGWYADEGCTTKVFFHEPTEAEIAAITDEHGVVAPYQVYERMPAHKLRIYAGWEKIWYKIELDPNGGVLTGKQSTFFWEPYDGDPIEEYNTATRNYEADVNGTFYYMLHDRAYYGLGDEWTAAEDNLKDRGASYTTDPTEATSPTRYRYAPGAYRYLGWYEYDPETGEEWPYNFGTHVTKDTYLRLHWKQLGTYHIKYEAGEGTIDTNDQNEITFIFFVGAEYSDHADVVVSRVANAPAGQNFVGWRIKNDPSGKIYYPGDSFRFRSDYAQSVSEINPTTGAVETHRTIIMEAVYDEIGNAAIIYDANGGRISNQEQAVSPENAGGAVTKQFRADDEGTKYSADETTLTVSDIVNNTAVKLSSGAGFYNRGYHFLGWSTEPDGSKNFYLPGSIKTYADTEDPITLYAQWEVKVYFDRNDVTDGNTYFWGNDTGNDWAADNEKYTYDEEKGMYYTTIKLNGKADRPDYTPTSSDDEEFFSHWSLEKQGAAGVMNDPFDFSTAVTQELIDSQANDGDYLVLHACWRAPIRIPVYYVDTSDAEWIRQDGWRKDGDGANIVLRDSTPVSLAGKSDADSYAQAGATSGYQYAFATQAGKNADDYQTITDDVQITEIWYDSDEMCVKARYSDGTEHEFDAANDAVYLVYYKSSENIPVKYERMSIDGSLSSVTVKQAAPKTANVVPEPPYNMNSNLTNPVSWAYNNYQYYSYAVGKSTAGTSADLKAITGYKTNDNDRPELLVRNNWNGFAYSFDGENWHNCGYDIALYTIYYEQRPTIVTLTEKTIALPDKMDTEFDYSITITQTESKTVRRSYGYVKKNSWRDLNSGNYRTTESPPTITTSDISTVTLTLSDSESDSYVLFFTQLPDSEITKWTDTGESYYYDGGQREVFYREDYVKQSISQTISIVQAPKTDFVTANDAETGNHVYNSSYTSSANSDPVTITYTNTHQLKLDLHVALKAGDSTIAHDELRVDDEAVYQHEFTGAGTWDISEVSPDALITNSDAYIFLGTVSGIKEADNSITVGTQNVTSASFGEVQENKYNYYLNGDTSSLLGEQDIWFVYCKKPVIRYQFEKPSGELVDIEPLNRNNEPFMRNGEPIAQNEILPVTMNDSLLISQISTPGTPAYQIPGDLDYQNDALKLDLNRICIGDSSGVQVSSESETVTLSIEDGSLNYRFSEADDAASMPEDPVVYAIYRVKGYELTLSKSVVGDSGENDTFTFTISSDQLTFSSYYISNYGDSDIIRSESGTLTLTLHKNDSVTIYGLLSGTYTVQEEAAGSCEMTAKINGVDAAVSQNQVIAAISDNTSIDIVNTYPIPVTGTGEQAAPYCIILLILTAAGMLFICRRKGEHAYEHAPL